ncbi:hypothetical protein [Alkalimarinus coralli]|uniref:hypothetical protein n=1 Tax=Alkalimarinus coralli TaxID=2935863 RepID=UPI00202B0C7F|nr:hypothetical protein [Alkalimarinus coralli]
MNHKSVGVTFFLVAVGSLQMLGDLTGWTALKGVGAASHASPAPKVFTAQEGFETFSSSFFIDWVDGKGELQTLTLSPENYRYIRGPYNRRNAYGAAISYGPVLSRSAITKPMFKSAVDFAFCRDRSLLRELPLPTPLPERLVVRIEPRDAALIDPSWQLVYPIKCDAEGV